jgi:hypothetical protein
MPLPALSRARFTADLTICRILNGMWQVSGAHGAIDPVRAIDAMSAYHEAGFTTWDLVDHYGPAEDSIGDFRRRFAACHGVDLLPEIQAFTKWVPRPGRMTRRVVKDAISISLARMGVERLDLLQFHWWDYGNDGYLEALKSSLRPPAGRQDPSSCAHQFRHPAPQCHRRPRDPRHLKPGAVLARRPPPRGSDGQILLRSSDDAPRLRHPARWAALAEILGPPRAASIRTQHRLFAEIQERARRLGRLAAVPEAARGATTNRRQTRGKYRQCRRSLRTGSSSGGWRNRRRSARYGAAPHRQWCLASNSTLMTLA